VGYGHGGSYAAHRGRHAARAGWAGRAEGRYSLDSRAKYPLDAVLLLGGSVAWLLNSCHRFYTDNLRILGQIGSTSEC